MEESTELLSPTRPPTLLSHHRQSTATGGSDSSSPPFRKEIGEVKKVGQESREKWGTESKAR
ncbi:hypothetical protein ACSBR1_020636 [Camellia fascicularis]